MTTETDHDWHEHQFAHYMASQFGLVTSTDEDDDFVLYTRCACGKTPLDVLMEMRVQPSGEEADSAAAAN